MPALAFLVAVADIPWLYSGPVVVRWALLAAGLPLVARLDWRAVEPFLLVLLVLGVGWAGVSALWSPDPLGGAWDWSHMLILAMAFVAGAGLRKIDPVMRALAWGIGVSSVLCVPQLLGWEGMPQAAVPGGLFLNRDVLAETAAPVFIWAFASAVSSGGWAEIGTALACAFPILVSGSRVAVGAVVLGGIYGARLTRSAKIKALAVVAGCSIAALLWLGPEKLESGAHRIALWGLAWHGIGPIGQGLGWFEWAYPTARQAHSDLLQLMAEIGIGALPLLAIPALALWRKAGNVEYRAALVASMATAALSFPLHLPVSGFILAVVAGHLSGRRWRVRDDELGVGNYARVGHGTAYAAR